MIVNTHRKLSSHVFYSFLCGKINDVATGIERRAHMFFYSFLCGKINDVDSAVVSQADMLLVAFCICNCGTRNSKQFSQMVSTVHLRAHVRVISKRSSLENIVPPKNAQSCQT